MDAYTEIVAALALTLGASWASGLNLYAVLVVLGLGGSSGHIDLPDAWQILENPLVIMAAGFMYCVEFFADKVPGVDSGWDALHTFIRIPAGGLLAASAMGDVNPAMELAAAILGGSVTASSHFTKASSRLLINTSPEPFTNWGASIAEDILVLTGLWAALNHPILFLIALVFFIGLVIWLLPKLIKAIIIIVKTIGRKLGFGAEANSNSA